MVRSLSPASMSSEQHHSSTGLPLWISLCKRDLSLTHPCTHFSFELVKHMNSIICTGPLSKSQYHFGNNWVEHRVKSTTFLFVKLGSNFPGEGCGEGAWNVFRTKQLVLSPWLLCSCPNNLFKDSRHGTVGNLNTCWIFDSVEKLLLLFEGW